MEDELYWLKDPLWKETVKHMGQGLMLIPLESRALFHYDQLDDAVEKTILRNFPEITCKAGCSHCCYQKIVISRAEAKLIVMAMKEMRIEVDWDHLKRQGKFMRKGDWHEMESHSEKKCIFLKDNLCQIYPIRPSACRWYFSISDPELCNLKSHPDGDILVPNNPLVSGLICALIAADIQEGKEEGGKTIPEAIYLMNKEMGDPLGKL